MSTRNLRIQLGALCPPIDEQLRDQGLRLDMDTTARALLQRDTHEVTRLLVRGILTEAEAHKARKRIMQIIKKQARPQPQPPPRRHQMLTKNTSELFMTVAQHIAADAVVQGKYWENGRGCFVGCLVHSPCAETLTIKYGIPLPLVRVLESIFESLNPVEARQFFADIPAAIAVDGRDLRLVVWQFLEETLRALPVQTEEIGAVIAGLALLAQGGEWPGAADAARAAADAADRAAARAAESRRQRDSVLRLIAAAPLTTTPTPEPPTDD